MRIFGCWMSLLYDTPDNDDNGKLNITIRYNREGSIGVFKGNVRMKVKLGLSTLTIDRLSVDGDLLDNGEFINVLKAILKTITSMYTEDFKIHLTHDKKKVPEYLKTLGFRRVEKKGTILVYKEHKENNKFVYMIDAILDKLRYGRRK